VPESLTDLCGGQFAIVPSHVIDDAEISTGAFWLYAAYSSRADVSGHGRFSFSKLAALRGCETRTLQRWRQELERAGLIEVTGGAKYKVIRHPDDRQKAKAKAAARAINNARFGAYGKKGASAKVTEMSPNKVTDLSPNEDESGQICHPEGDRNVAQKVTDLSPIQESFKKPSSRGGTDAPLASPLEGGSRGAAPVLTNKLRSIERRLKNGDIGPLMAARFAQRLVDEVYIEQDREHIAQVINTALKVALTQPGSPLGVFLSKQAAAGRNIENVWRELVCMPEGDAKRLLEGVQSEVAA